MSYTYPWAEDMLAVIKTVSEDIAEDLALDCGEGIEIDIIDGNKILKVFFDNSFETVTKTIGGNGLWLVHSKEGDNHGLTIDFRSNMSETGCYLLFYSDENYLTK